MEFEMFYKPCSGPELGTTKASMNRTRKTNASGGPKIKYNEYTDFHQCEVEGHICAGFMEMSGMTKANGMHNDQAQGWCAILRGTFFLSYL